jgi:1-acyl-sn-glycerol-3-phosphate acyltransferase
MVRAALRAVYEYLWFYTAFLYFAICGLACSILSSVLYIVLPRRVGARFGKWMVHRAFRRFLQLLQATGRVQLDLSALDALRGEPGLIIAPNHPCLLDAVFIISRLPNVACIMKAEIRDNILLGAGARLAGYIRNDSASNMLRGAVRELREGHQLLVFPEGTRTRRRPVNSFKGGIALIAKYAGAPLQTVFIETDSPFLGKGWPLFKMPALPLVYRARLGRRFHVRDDVRASIAELEIYFRQELSGITLVEPEATPAAVNNSPRPGAAA